MVSIPVRDIPPLCKTEFGSVDAQRAKDHVTFQINQAFKAVGFFYVTGHGVDQSVIQQIFTAAKNLFALPLEKKKAIDIHNCPSFSGYIETRSEKTQNVIDIREGFYFHLNNPSNQLPEENDLPGFANTIAAYTKEVTKLRFVMMKALAVGLGLPDNYFDEKFSQPSSFLSLLHYPPHPADTDFWGVGPHTDYGMFTFLLQGDVSGLEVEVTEGHWIEAKPIPGGCVP